MDENEIDELIQSIDEIEDEGLGQELFLDLFDIVGANERAG